MSALRTIATKVGTVVVGATLGLGIGAAGALAYQQVAPQPEPISYEDVQEQPSRAEVLIERHDCWTSDAPADMRGELPGHAVVTVGGRVRYTDSTAALEHVFHSEHPQMVVHGFCR